MAAGSLESGWWCRQSQANPSPPISLINREKTGNFCRIIPQYARLSPLTHWYRRHFGSNSLKYGTGNFLIGTGNLIRGTGNYLGGSGNHPTVCRCFKSGTCNRRYFAKFRSRTGEDPRTGVDVSKAWEDGGEQQREDRTHPLTLSENTPNR